jgi:hypothetical protein
MENISIFIFISGIITSKLASRSKHEDYILAFIVVLISIITVVKRKQCNKKSFRRALSFTDKSLVAAEEIIIGNQQTVNNTASSFGDIIFSFFPFLNCVKIFNKFVTKITGKEQSAATEAAAFIHVVDTGIKELEKVFESDTPMEKGSSSENNIDILTTLVNTTVVTKVTSEDTSVTTNTTTLTKNNESNAPVLTNQVSVTHTLHPVESSNTQ